MSGRFVKGIIEQVDEMLRFFFVITVAVVAGLASAAQREGRFNRYLIYTRANFNNPIELDLTDATTVAALTLEKKTAIIIHGHQGSGTTSLNPTVKSAFLQSGDDIDVIVVDWSLYAGQSFNNALLAVQSVADGVANTINELVTQNVVALDSLHIVGFNLGAHVAGYVGRALDGTVARITGLDPAKADGGATFQRLRNTDALYVEVLHTDGIGLNANGIGDAIGDVDVYVNGGTNQPGCPFNNKCSHNRAWELFAATLNHNHLTANQCGTWLQVTLNTCRGITLKPGGNEPMKFGFGMYRVNTKRTYPY